MTETKHSLWTRLYRGETSFDFVGRRNRWFLVSGTVIAIGLIMLLVRGLNFGIEFKGGTVWEVRSNASVTHVRDVIGQVSPDMRQATIEILTDRSSGAKTVRVSAHANATKDKTKLNEVSDALAKIANVDVNQVTVNDVGPTWGHDITQKAERALVIFLVAVVVYITFRFEGKMAIAALIALLHDILVTIGVYALSGFTVSPATVIAFLTILGYSLYDTIVVFDKIEENTKGLAASGRITYTETVNLSMNQVLMRSINTSVVAIMPILSILVIGSYFLGASALEDFGLALFIGLLTGAYSSIFIAAPVLALMKEREPRYAQIRQRLANRASMTGVLTPAAAASGELLGAAAGAGGAGRGRSGSAGGGGGGGAGGRAGGAAAAARGGRRSEAAPEIGKTAWVSARSRGRSGGGAGAGDGDDADEVRVGSGRGSGSAAGGSGRDGNGSPAGAGAGAGAGSKAGGAGGDGSSGGGGAGAENGDPDRSGGGGGGGGGGAASPGGGGSRPPQASKPRPGAPNRSGGSSGGGAPRPRKKGKRR